MRVLVLILGLILNLMLLAGARELGRMDGLQTFILLFVLNFIAILFHELGHAWAFRHVGGTVKKIVVLFLSYNVPRRQFGWYRGRSNGDVGGFVVGRYRPSGPTVRDKIIVAAAGPVANLVTGSLAFAMAAIWPVPAQHNAPAIEAVTSGAPTPGSTVATLPSDAEVAATLERVDAAIHSLAAHQFCYTALTLFGTLSIGIALLNLLPFRGSDGQAIARALRLRRAMTTRRN